MVERAPEYAQLLCFDVPIEKEAEDLANSMGVKIFTANIIYHLFDAYTAYMAKLEEEKRKELTPQAVFPCRIKMVPEAIFNKKAPIIIGVS
jgi:translation initiation factor 5B